MFANWLYRLIAVGIIVVALPAARADEADPSTIDEVAVVVQRMKADGASNRKLAEYVTGVVDRRIVNGNGIVEGTLYRMTKDGQKADERFAKERNSLRAIPGREYESIAKWSWFLGYGNCAENAVIVYYIFKTAGIPARTFECAGGGHAYTAIGLADGFDPTDLTTWGPDAYIADSWLGRTVTPEQGRSMHFINGVPWYSFQSPAKSPTRSDVTVTYDSPVRYENAYLRRGFIAGSVVDETTRAPIAGARVVVTADAAETGNRTAITLQTGADGVFRGPPGQSLRAGHYRVGASLGSRTGVPVDAVVTGSHTTTEVVLLLATPKSSASTYRPDFNLLPEARRLCFGVSAGEVTTAATFAHRRAVLIAVFYRMGPSDRQAIFGVTEFNEVDQVLREAGSGAYVVLDRFLIRLQVTFH